MYDQRVALYSNVSVSPDSVMQESRYSSLWQDNDTDIYATSYNTSTMAPDRRLQYPSSTVAMFAERPWYPSTAGRPLAEFNEIGIYDHHYSQLSATGHGFSAFGQLGEQTPCIDLQRGRDTMLLRPAPFSNGLNDLNQWIPRLSNNHIQIGDQPKLVNDCGNMHDSSYSLSSGQATRLSSLAEVPVRTVTRGPGTAWYYPPMLSPTPSLTPVPQKIYKSRTRFCPHNVATYCIPQSLSRGISLRQILDGEITGLWLNELVPATMRGSKASIRVLWPGYPSHSRQINLSRTGKPLAIGALAVKIAKELQFLVDCHSFKYCTKPEWRLGPGFIQFEHIFLTEVLQVSKASLQPVLYVSFPGERVG